MFLLLLKKSKTYQSMRKVLILILLIFSTVLVSQAQSKSGYRIQGSKSKGGRGGSDWTNNVFIQPNFGFAFSSYGLYLNVSPTVGYIITEGLVAGVGASYTYSKTENPNPNGDDWTSNTYGGNLFARYVVKEPVFIMVQYEFMTTQWSDLPDRQNYDTFLAGGGIIQPMGKGGAFVLSVLYNFNYDSTTIGENGPYTSPYVITAGVMFGF